MIGSFVQLMLQGVADPVAHSMQNKGGSAPSPDPLIGKAAMKQAELADEAFDFYKSWYETEGRDRQVAQDALSKRLVEGQLSMMDEQLKQGQDYYKYQLDTFRPMERQIVADAQAFDTEAERERVAGEAVADTQQAFARSQQQLARDRSRYGVNPNDGMAQQQESDLAIARAATQAHNANRARQVARDMGYARKIDAVSLGRNLPANSATAYGVSLNAAQGAGATGQANLASARGGLNVMGQGYGTAMQGWGTAGNLMNQQYSNQLAAYQANQAKSGSIWGAVGMVGGAIVGGPMGAAIGGAMANSMGGGKTPNSDFGINWGDYADGGPIYGPGTGTSDSIPGTNTDTGTPVQVSNGEYVIPADVVRAKGVEFFDKLLDKYHTPVRGRAGRTIEGDYRVVREGA